MRAVLVDDAAGARLARSIVWIHILGGDDDAAAARASEIFPEEVPQYWDPEALAGRAVSETLGLGDGPAWDIYLFYPPGARWGDRPAAVLAQVGGAQGTVVVAGRGAFPPLPDQAGLPEGLRGRAEVVGRQPDLPRLLRDAAARTTP